MTLIVPYFISFLAGLCVVLSILKDNKRSLSSLFLISVSFGLGLALCSMSTFFCTILFEGYHPLLILFLNVSLTALLGCLNIGPLKRFSAQLLIEIKASIKNGFVWAGSIFYIILCFYIRFAASLHPWGDWDAWALWNMKLKFILYNGADWTDIFHKLHWHTQPDYPLLLPMMNAWGLCLYPQYPQINAPMMTSILFTLLGVLLLYSTLSLFIPRLHAYLASLICLANPYYVYKATAQYADTAFTYYLLGCLVFLYLAVQYKERSFASILGLFLGVLSFCKNEGIAIFLLIASIFLLSLIIHKEISNPTRKNIALWFLGSFFFAAVATIVLKFLAPANRDILTNLNGQLSYFNWEGILLVKKHILEEINDKRWVHIWHIGLLLSVLGIPKLLRRDIWPITVFLLSYFIILLFIYLTTTTMDLSWRLKSTVPRIFFYLMPAMLFITFLIHFKKDPAKDR